MEGEAVDLSMGYVNLIWQGDALDYIARAVSLASAPMSFLNVTGPEIIPLRYMAKQIGAYINRPVQFKGNEEKDALISDAERCFKIFGHPCHDLDFLIKTITFWVAQGKPSLNKPTRYDQREGRF